MKTSILLLFILLSGLITAQDCTLVRYQELLREANRASQQGQYDLSLNKLQSAKTCRPEKQGEVDQKIEQVFREVNRQREIAVLNLEKANRLIHHLDFRKESAAWAYKNNKFAVINLNGDTLTDFKYETPQPFIGGRALVSINNQYAFIDAMGNEQSERYDFLLPMQNNCYMAGRGEKRKLLNNKGEVLFLLESSDWGNWEKRTNGYLVCISADNKRGLIDSTFNLVIPPEYDNLSNFYQGLIQVEKNGKKGALDTEGRVKIPCIYDDLRLEDGMAEVKISYRWGLVDTNGTERIKPQWDDIRWMPAEKIIGVNKNGMFGKWGILDVDGKAITGLIYDDIGYDFYDGLLTFKKGKQTGSINRYGVEVNEQLAQFETNLRTFKYRRPNSLLDTAGLITLLSPYDDYIILEENLFGIKKDGFWRAIDRKGKEVLPVALTTGLSELFWAGEGMLGIYKTGKIGLIKTDGTELFPPVYNSLDQLGPDSIGLFSLSTEEKKGIVKLDGTVIAPEIYDEIEYDEKCGLIRIRKDKKCGLLNLLGEILIPLQYDKLWLSSHGVLWAQKDDNLIILNTNVAYLTPPRYQGMVYFTENLNWVQNGEGWILIDRNGKVVTQNSYVEPSELKNGFAHALRGGKRGILNSKGVEVVKPLYEYIDEFRHGHAWVTRSIGQGNTKIGIIDTTGKEIVPPQYDLSIGRLAFVSEDIMVVFKNNKSGLLHLSGKELIEPKYEEIRSIEDSKTTIRVKKDNKWGIADTNGMELIPPQFDGISGFREDGTIWVERNKKEGFIDSTGKEIIKIEYDYVDIISDGWILTLKDRKEGHFKFIRPSGAAMRNDVFYEDAKSFSKGFAAVKKGEKWRLIDTAGMDIRTLEYNEIANFSEGMACVEKDGKWGFINSNWVEIIEPIYDEVEEDEFSGGVAWVRKGDKWGAIDKTGSVLIEPQFDEYGEYGYDSIFWVSIEGKYGLIKKDGKIIIPADYDDVPNHDQMEFKFGVELIEKSGKFGIINRKGEVIIPAKYDDIETLANGWAIGSQDGKCGIIDTTEQVILPFEYSEIYPSGFRQFTLEQNGRFGFFAPDYNIILPCIYEKIGYPGEEKSWIRVQQNGKWGWVDNIGRVMIPILYDAISPFTAGKAEVTIQSLPHVFTIDFAGKLVLE